MKKVIISIFVIIMLIGAVSATDGYFSFDTSGYMSKVSHITNPSGTILNLTGGLKYGGVNVCLTDGSSGDLNLGGNKILNYSGTNLNLTKPKEIIIAQDGSGDFNCYDESCIQEAINYINSSSNFEKIYIKSGEYTINNPLILVNNLYIEGGSKTILKAKNSLNDVMIDLFDVGGNVTIKGLTLDGNKINQDTVCISCDIIGRKTSSTQNKININVIDNVFKNVKYMAVNMDNWQDGSMVANNHFENMDYVAIRVHSNDNVIVRNNYIDANNVSFAGIFIDSRNNIIDGNTIKINSNSIGAIRFEADGTFDVKGNKVINNIIIGNANLGSGIVMSGSYTTGNTFTNNEFQDLNYGFNGVSSRSIISDNTFINTNRGLQLSSTNLYNIIKGNIFYDMPSGSFGLRCYSCQKNLISNNFFESSTYSYYEQDSANYNYVIGNFQKNATYGITITGASSESINNKITS